MEKIKGKKEYPSQLNTKSIACRIPISDYVNFLEEANERGINLNDWLLTKIYGKSKSIGNNDSLEVNISRNEILEVLSHDHNGELYDQNTIKEHSKALEFYFGKSQVLFENIDREDIKALITNLVSCKWWANELFNVPNEKIANIEDVKNQLTILINNKFNNSKDRKEYRNELLPLLRELE
jgi:hypothetical protein